MRRRRQESGFALLAVFAMAATVALMLYLELPRVAFETQRQKEQLLVERGEQYRRAIQLYVRKKKKFPQSLDDLEKDNNLRYLRKRYKDPMTGDTEWRLIHVGPTGEFTDSLVYKPAKEEKKENQNTFITEMPTVGSTGQGTGQASLQDRRRRQSDQAGAPGQGVPGSEGQQPGGEPVPSEVNPSVGYFNPSAPPPAPPQGQPGQFPQGQPMFPPVQPGQPVDPALLQQWQQMQQQAQQQGGQPQGFPPAPGGMVQGPGGLAVPPPQGMPYNPILGRQGVPVQPASSQTFGGVAAQPVQQQPGSAFGSYGSSLGGGTVGSGFGQPQYPQQQGGFPSGQMRPPTGGFPPGVAPPTGAGVPGQIIEMLRNPSPRGGLPAASGMSGVGLGAGIAGVASKLEAEGIKVYNERTAINEWEFVYDWRKDTSVAGPGMGVFQGQAGQQANPLGGGLSGGSMGGGGFGGSGLGGGTTGGFGGGTLGGGSSSSGGSSNTFIGGPPPPPQQGQPPSSGFGRTK